MIQNTCVLSYWAEIVRYFFHNSVKRKWLRSHIMLNHGLAIHGQARMNPSKEGPLVGSFIFTNPQLLFQTRDPSLKNTLASFITSQLQSMGYEVDLLN